MVGCPFFLGCFCIFKSLNHTTGPFFFCFYLSIFKDYFSSYQLIFVLNCTSSFKLFLTVIQVLLCTTMKENAINRGPFWAFPSKHRRAKMQPLLQNLFMHYNKLGFKQQNDSCFILCMFLILPLTSFSVLDEVSSTGVQL